MKNQYLCDINDYRKYGLLRILAKEFSICVGWMMTADDGRTDGNKRRYLSRANDRRDPPLFAALKRIQHQAGKTIHDVAGSGIIPGAMYYPDEVPQVQWNRDRYFGKLKSIASSSDLVFLDPDNGVEVKSYPKGHINSVKYVYWDEVTMLWSMGKSLLVYQHFPRIKRGVFIPWLSGMAKKACPGADCLMIKAGNVGYLAILQQKHITKAESALAAEMGRWGKDLSFFSNT